MTWHIVPALHILKTIHEAERKNGVKDLGVRIPTHPTLHQGDAVAHVSPQLLVLIALTTSFVAACIHIALDTCTGDSCYPRNPRARESRARGASGRRRARQSREWPGFAGA